MLEAGQGRAGLYPELAESLLPYAITSAATGLSVLKGVKQTSPGGSLGETQGHIAKGYLAFCGKYNLPQLTNQHNTVMQPVH